jgi:hypothetical protein
MDMNEVTNTYKISAGKPQLLEIQWQKLMIILKRPRETWFVGVN